MDDSLPGTICPHILHPAGDAPSDVSGMQPHSAHSGSTQGDRSHGRVKCSLQPDSQGEPWPDAEPWQGQDSQLSLTSTQGVDPFA